MLDTANKEKPPFTIEEIKAAKNLADTLLELDGTRASLSRRSFLATVTIANATGFILYPPKRGRRTFQILPYRREASRRHYGSPIEHADLAALNASLLAGRLTEAEVWLELRTKLLPQLKKRSRTKDRVLVDSRISENNMKVFEDFWRQEYRRRRLEAPETTRFEFKAALALLEPLSLHTADVDDLQDHWDSKLKGSRHKKYGNKVNQLLRFLDRGFEIHTDAATRPPHKWVSWVELLRICENVEAPQLVALYKALWATGCRIGELFLLTPSEIKANGSLFINKQMTADKNAKTRTKNGTAHDTYVLPEGRSALAAWAAVDNKEEFRGLAGRVLKAAALKTFSSTPLKQITPHKLRHSYVKQMLTLGVPLHRVAQFLGDRVSTVETEYREWVVSDAEIDFVNEIVTQGYKRLSGAGIR